MAAARARVCVCVFGGVQAYLFQGYWEDIGTIEAFYNANLNCVKPSPNFSFYDKNAPIYTQSRFLPPSKLVDCTVSDAMIGDGCLIQRSTIKNSLVGVRSLIFEGCTIEDSLLMGADYFETYAECSALPGCTPIGIGAGTTVRRAIIDKNARIGMDCQIVNKDGVQEANREESYYVIKDGIITIMKDSIIPPPPPPASDAATPRPPRARVRRRRVSPALRAENRHLDAVPGTAVFVGGVVLLSVRERARRGEAAEG